MSESLDQLITSARIALDDTLDSQQAAMIKAWASTWDDLAVEWRAAIAELEALRVDGKWPSRRKVLAAARVKQALAQTRQALDALCADAGVEIAGALPDITATAAAIELDMIRAQLPPAVGDTWPLTRPAALDAIVARSTQQVTKLAKVLGKEAERDLKQLLVRGVATGTNPRRTAALMLRRIEDRTVLTRDRADTIARTEILDAHRAAAAQARTANADVLAGWSWVCHPSERTCRACLAQHGSLHDLDEPGPLGHQRCRCTAAPRTKTWRDLGIDMDDDREPIESGEDWLRRQPRDVQDKALTPAGAAAWRKGNWPPSKWGVKRSNDGWRDAWYQAPPPKPAR